MTFNHKLMNTEYNRGVSLYFRLEYDGHFKAYNTDDSRAHISRRTYVTKWTNG